jgi:thioredoxin 2
VVQEVARELAGKGVVVQVNSQENPRLADRFRIRSIPAVLVLKRGQVIDSVNGAMDRNSLLAWWRRHAG